MPGKNNMQSSEKARKKQQESHKESQAKTIGKPQSKPGKNNRKATEKTRQNQKKGHRERRAKPIGKTQRRPGKNKTIRKPQKK